MIQLVIGNANYSSWSMRGWLLMRLSELQFDLKVISQNEHGWQDRVRALGGQTGQVPFLIVESHAIWDTMAIAEYCHEQSGRIWPGDPRDRATARSYASEMHSGFNAIRATMPCNIRARQRQRSESVEVATQIERISAIWSLADRSFLFGEFSGADIFFAPVAARFRTYEVKLTGAAANYQQALLDHPLVEEWTELGRDDPFVERYELPFIAQRAAGAFAEQED